MKSGVSGMARYRTTPPSRMTMTAWSKKEIVRNRAPDNRSTRRSNMALARDFATDPFPVTQGAES